MLYANNKIVVPIYCHKSCICSIFHEITVLKNKLSYAIKLSERTNI